MSDRPEDYEIIGSKVGDGPYEGLSSASICVRIQAASTPEAEARLLRFIMAVAKVAEEHHGIELIGDTEGTVTCLSQNLVAATQLLRREEAAQRGAREN